MKTFVKTLSGLLLVFNVFNEVASWDRPRNAAPGQFPFLISLEWSNLPISPAMHLCGGVILTEDWVMSSAYCIVRVHVGTVVVKAGRHNIAADDQHVQVRNIIKRLVNQKYAGTQHLMNLGTHDLSLIKVGPSFEFNARVQPAKLPKKDGLISGQRIDYNLILSGWGSPAHLIIQNHPKVLQTVQVPVVDNRVCTTAIQNIFHNYRLDDSQMCTRPLDGSLAACIGDYGGPLIQYDSRNEPVIIAIMAYSTGNCNTNNLPLIYSRVSPDLTWIKKSLKL